MNGTRKSRREGREWKCKKRKKKRRDLKSREKIIIK